MIKNSNESLVFLVISRQPRNLLNAVFVNQTLRTASGDEELAFKQRQRDLKNYQNKVGLRLPGLLRNWWFLFLPAVSFTDIECKLCIISRSLGGFVHKFSSHLGISWGGYPDPTGQGSDAHNDMEWHYTSRAGQAGGGSFKRETAINCLHVWPLLKPSPLSPWNFFFSCFSSFFLNKNLIND